MGSLTFKQAEELLVRLGNGQKPELNAILPEIYGELRRIARYHLRQQRPNHTLQTTALVHEAYLRLARDSSLAAENRMQILGIAGQLMRWILVDYERSRRTAKRGAGAERLTLEGATVPEKQGAPPLDLLALNSALDRLEKLDPEQSQIVELRYFGGLSTEETAEFLGISIATVKRRWASARLWLLREIKEGEAAS